MKALLLLPLLFVACSTPVVVTRGGPGQMTIVGSGRLGGKGGLMVRDGQFAMMEYSNNENSMRDVMSGWAWSSFWKAAGGAAQSLFDSNKDVDIAGVRADILGQQAEVDKLRITTAADVATEAINQPAAP